MEKGFELKITVSEEFADLVAQKMSDKNVSVRYYSVKDVAELLQTTNTTIHKHIELGLLEASKPGKNYIITQKQLDEYINTNKK